MTPQAARCVCRHGIYYHIEGDVIMTPTRVMLRRYAHEHDDGTVSRRRVIAAFVAYARDMLSRVVWLLAVIVWRHLLSLPPYAIDAARYVTRR